MANQISELIVDYNNKLINDKKKITKISNRIQNEELYVSDETHFEKSLAMLHTMETNYIVFIIQLKNLENNLDISK